MSVRGHRARNRLREWVDDPQEIKAAEVGVAGMFNERHAALSADGRLVAYMSNESGRAQINVRSFTEPQSVDGAGRPVGATGAEGAVGQWQISTAGSIFPRWARDGRELYYIGSEGHMMAAPVRTDGPRFSRQRRSRCSRRGLWAGAMTSAKVLNSM